MYKLSRFGKCCTLSHRIRSVPEFTRGVFYITGKWAEKLNRHLRLNVEKYWKDKLHDMDISMNNQARSISNDMLCQWLRFLVRPL